MLYSNSIAEVTEDQSALNELFEDLQKAESALQRQELVSGALAAGVDQDEIREMLDYIESFGNAYKPREVFGSRISVGEKPSLRRWTSFLSGWIYRYR